jgi:hypothetical protein
LYALRIRRVSTKVTFQRNAGIRFLVNRFDRAGSPAGYTLVYFDAIHHDNPLGIAGSFGKGTGNYRQTKIFFDKNPYA